MIEGDLSRQSSSVSSSSFEINDSDVRLSQLRRSAQQSKATQYKGQNRLMARFQGLMSYDQMVKDHAMKRMQEGFKKLLSLHSAVELSSICGCLKLKVQEKGSISVEQILRYASEGGELQKDKILNILNFMWEGVLFEYLQSIGHPVHSRLPDPKNTILELWETGGMIDVGRSFTPHFIAREVQKRYEYVQSDDIQYRLDKLYIAQEKCKAAEIKVMADHDYHNILTYFHLSSELRRLESSAREFFISELESARNRVESLTEQTKIHREQLVEHEIYFMNVVEELNNQLAHSECLNEQAVRDKFQMEKQLQRVMGIMDSFDESITNSIQPGHDHLPCLYIPDKEEDNVHLMIKNLHNRLQNYREFRDNYENDLRLLATEQNNKIVELNEEMEQLIIQIKEREEILNSNQNQMNELHNEFLSNERKFIKYELKHQIITNTSWECVGRMTEKVYEKETKIVKIKPLLVSGLQHPTNILLNQTCEILLLHFKLSTEFEIINMKEIAHMSREDQRSASLRNEIKKNNVRMIGSKANTPSSTRYANNSMIRSKSSKSNSATPTSKSPTKFPKVPKTPKKKGNSSVSGSESDSSVTSKEKNVKANKAVRNGATTPTIAESNSPEKSKKTAKKAKK